jgi:hypothetical protein
MVKSAKDRPRRDLAEPLNWTKKRRVLSKAKMRSEIVVVGGVGPEDPAKMRFAQDHDMIQAFSPDRADEPFDVSVIGYVSGGALTSC